MIDDRPSWMIGFGVAVFTVAAPRPGDVVRVAVPPEHLHWFDASSGARVA